MRPSTLSILATGLLAVSFWGGLEAGERKWANSVAAEIRHHQLSDLRGCLFAIDSDTMRFVRSPSNTSTEKLAWRIGQCSLFLTSLGEDEQDEETSRTLGEAKLFFEGYAVALNAIIVRQVQLEALYNDYSIGAAEKIRKYNS